MKNILFTLGGLILVLAAGCNNSGDTGETATVPVDKNQAGTADDARTSLDWAGTYKGVTPCADCEGTETTVVLHQNNKYAFSAKYLGKKDTLENKMEGKWKWLDGFTIELEGITESPSKYFVSEGRIVQLDMEGKRIEGALADKYVLNKEN